MAAGQLHVAAARLTVCHPMSMPAARPSRSARPLVRHERHLQILGQLGRLGRLEGGDRDADGRAAADAVALASIAAGLEASDTPLAPFYLRPPDAKPQDKAIARV